MYYFQKRPIYRHFKHICLEIGNDLATFEIRIRIQMSCVAGGICYRNYIYYIGYGEPY